MAGYDVAGVFAGHAGPLPDEHGGYFGARLAPAPLGVDVECQTIVIGIASFSNPTICAVPAEIGIAAWSDAGAEDPETGETMPATVPGAVMLPVPNEKEDFDGHAEAGVYRFAHPVLFKAGEYPFAALQLQQAICAVRSQPLCDGSIALRYRPDGTPGAGWAPLSHAKSTAPREVPDLADQLVIAAEDCTAVTP